MRHGSAPDGHRKPLHWVGSSKKDLLEFPGEVVDDFGYALSVVQHGGMPPSAKAWKENGTSGLRGALCEGRRRRRRRLTPGVVTFW